MTGWRASATADASRARCAATSTSSALAGRLRAHAAPLPARQPFEGGGGGARHAAWTTLSMLYLTLAGIVLHTIVERFDERLPTAANVCLLAFPLTAGAAACCRPSCCAGSATAFRTGSYSRVHSGHKRRRHAARPP